MARWNTYILCMLLFMTMAVAFGPSFSRNVRVSQRARPFLSSRHVASIPPEENENEKQPQEEDNGNENENKEDMESFEFPGSDGQDEEEEPPSTMMNDAIGSLGVQPVGPGEVVFIVMEDGNDSLQEEEEEEDDDEEEEVPDPYAERASSEFTETRGSRLDWGGALGKLRERVNDVETGASQSPSTALFRIMTSQTPNQAIGDFVNTANPQVVAAMSSAVNSLLGGLSNPAMGVETVVKASGEKIGSLCFQLQMTGYMFRNAEYVLALKDIMNLKGSKTIDAYKEAFERIDKDGSGFIETDEIEALLREVYEDKPPAFEVKAFMDFFDANGDGKISWGEFEKGLGDMTEQNAAKAVAAGTLLPTLADHDDDDDDDDYVSAVEPEISGTIVLELEDGKTVEVCAKEYMKNLKSEANALKAALKQERQLPESGRDMRFGVMPPSSGDMTGGLANYIASREGDLKSLTEGINSEIVDVMKRIVDFILAGGDSRKGEMNKPLDDKAQMEMELPGSALQQLALWQLVLGYRLREAEAKGEYVRLLDN